MFCTKCGKEIDQGARFCRFCGQPTEEFAQNVQPNAAVGNVPRSAKKSFFFKAALALAAVFAVAIIAVAGAALVGGDSKPKKVSDEGEEADRQPEKGEPERGADAASVLQEYLDDVLAVQPGYADLEARKLVLTNSQDLYEMDLGKYDNWMQAAGITDARICDLDGDGQDELVAAFVDGQKTGISVYESKEGGVVEQVEISEERAADLNGYGTVWMMSEAADGKLYLLWREEAWGVLSDGYYRNLRAWRYDGDTLVKSMEILQTDGGSSDFEYTAYQYDEKGELSLEEVIYREHFSDDSGEAIDKEYYKERTGEMLAGYGIGSDEADFLYAIGDEQYGKAAYNVAGQVLLRLEVAGDYQGDRLVYRFNDWDGPRNAYWDFLEGKEKAYVSVDSFWLDAGAGYTVGELFEKIKASFQNDGWPELSPRFEYAFLDCGDDGVEDLAIRLVGLGIYDPGDDSDATMVITRRNGRLEIVYACESWARSYSDVNYYGCISGFGSSGAGDNTGFLAYLDGSGNYNRVYECNYLGGWWTSYLADDIFLQVFADGEPSLEIEIWSMGDSQYYVANIPEDDAERCMKYVELCRQQGMNFVAAEEVGRAVEQRQRDLGIQDEWIAEGESDPAALYWVEWNGWK